MPVNVVRLGGHTGINVPQVRTPFVDLGNVVRTAETVKNLKSRRNLFDTQQEAADLKLQEFKAGKSARATTATKAATLTDLNISSKKLELASKAVDAMKNELVSISVDQYPAFLEKWKKAGIGTDKLPSVEQIGNDPKRFRAFQRQAVQTADSFQKEVEAELDRKQALDIEDVKQRGTTTREKIKTLGQETRERVKQQRLAEKDELDIASAEDKEKIKTAGQKEREKIKQDAAIAREKIKEAGATARKKITDANIKPTGDMANFQIIHGRKPKSAAEFKKFKLAIKDETKLTDEQKEIKKSYFQAIGRANDAKRGTGQFVPDPNKEDVANDEYKRAQTLKQAFLDVGGKLEHLGESESDLPQIKKGTIIKNNTTGERRKWNGTQWQTIK